MVKAVFCRYGFQNQLRDDEIYGSGNSYSAEYWQYDTRLGRRWNVDPIVKPWESSYATFSNNPIYFIDPSGLTASDFKTKRSLWDRLFNRMSNNKKHGDKTGFGKFFDKLFGKIEDLLSGNGDKTNDQSPKPEPKGSDYPPGWNNGHVLDEVNIIGSRRRPLVPEGYYILIDPNSKNVVPIAEPWVQVPNIVPNGNLGVGVVSDLNPGAGGGLPSGGIHWTLNIPEFVDKSIKFGQELWNAASRYLPFLSKGTPNSDDVIKRTEKAAGDNHGKPDSTLTIYHRSNGGKFYVKKAVDGDGGMRGTEDSSKVGDYEYEKKEYNVAW